MSPPSPERDSDVGNKISVLGKQPGVPVLNRQGRSYNCEECAFQASGGGSSKALLKHSKDSGHKTNSLEERGYNSMKSLEHSLTLCYTDEISILIRSTNVDILLKANVNLNKDAGTVMKEHLTRSM